MPSPGKDQYVSLRAARVFSAALASVALGVVTALPAAAEPPADLTGQVYDSAGALSDSDVAEVLEAFDRVAAETGQVVFVAFVSDFDGATGGDWAVESAVSSGLGSNNPLLAVAIDEGAWGVSGDDNAPYSPEALDQRAGQDVVPHLSQGDWSQAAIAFAEAVEDLAAEDSDTSSGEHTGGSGGGFGTGTLLVLVLLAGLVIGGYVLYRWWQRRNAPPLGPDGKPLPPGHPLTLPTEELAVRAGQALLETDNDLRSSDEELGFAQAQFGLEATDRYTAALNDAKQLGQRAFSLRQQIDDGTIDAEDHQRQAYAEILSFTERIGEALEAQSSHFATLRDLQAKAPQALAEMGQRADEVSSRLDGARARLAHLGTQYPRPPSLPWPPHLMRQSSSFRPRATRCPPGSSASPTVTARQQ